jgi:hypothetical protein
VRHLAEITMERDRPGGVWSLAIDDHDTLWLWDHFHGLRATPALLRLDALGQGTHRVFALEQLLAILTEQTGRPSHFWMRRFSNGLVTRTLPDAVEVYAIDTWSQSIVRFTFHAS